MIYILSGKINSGKSMFVLDLARKLIAQGKCLFGFITTPYFENFQKVGQNLVLLQESNIEEPVPFTRLREFANSFKWRRFYFNKEAFRRVEKIKLAGDLFVMDEIGPLELEDHQGFFEVMNDAVLKCKNTLLVIREDLKERIVAEINPKEGCFLTTDSAPEFLTLLQKQP